MKIIFSWAKPHSHIILILFGILKLSFLTEEILEVLIGYLRIPSYFDFGGFNPI